MFKKYKNTIEKSTQNSIFDEKKSSDNSSNSRESISYKKKKGNIEDFDKISLVDIINMDFLSINSNASSLEYKKQSSYYFQQKQPPNKINNLHIDKNKYSFPILDRSRKITMPITSSSFLLRTTSIILVIILPAIAPFIAIASAGFLAVGSTIDSLLHNKFISILKKDPNKAIDYYKRQYLYGNKFAFFGSSKAATYLNLELKKSNAIKNKLSQITSVHKKIRNGKDVLELLTLSNHEFLLKEMKNTLLNLDKNVIEGLFENLKINNNSIFDKIMSNFRSNKNNHKKSTSKIVEKIDQMSNEWNMYYEKFKEGKLESNKKEKLKTIDSKLKLFWNNFELQVSLNISTNGSFNKNFSKKAFAREEFLKQNLGILEKIFVTDAVLDYFKNNPIPENISKIPFDMKKEIKEFKKLNINERNIDSFKANLESKIDVYFKINNLNDISSSKNLKRVKQNISNFIDNIVNKAVVSKTKIMIRTNLAQRGLSNTIQCAIGVGTLGILMPPIAPIFAVTATGILITGTLATTVSILKAPKSWEKKYNNILEKENSKQQSIEIEKISSFGPNSSKQKTLDSKSLENLELRLVQSQENQKTYHVVQSFKRIKYLSQAKNLSSKLVIFSSKQLAILDKDIRRIGNFYSTTKNNPNKSKFTNEVSSFISGLGNSKSEFRIVRSVIHHAITVNQSKILDSKDKPRHKYIPQIAKNNSKNPHGIKRVL